MMGQYAEEQKFSFNLRQWLWGATSGSGRWNINGEETENVKVLKHLWVWFDQGMLGNVQMKKMQERTDNQKR